MKQIQRNRTHYFSEMGFLKNTSIQEEFLLNKHHDIVLCVVELHNKLNARGQYYFKGGQPIIFSKEDCIEIIGKIGMWMNGVMK